MNLIKNKINKSFTRSVKTYDKYSYIQNSISNKMIFRLNKKNIKSILEVGTGTGNYALQLRQKYPDAELFLVDFSKDMIEIAKQKLGADKNIIYLNIDAEDMTYVDKKFDIITSNATFQWFENLNNYLHKTIKFLNRGGMLLFSYFGNRTFNELNETMKLYYRKDINLPAYFFYNREELRRIINSLKVEYKIEEFIETIKYPDLLSLLKEIRGTGEYGYGVNKEIFLTRKSIRDIETIYISIYKKIVATYHFFIIGIWV